MKRDDLMNKDVNFRNVKVIFTNGKSKSGILNYNYTTFDYFIKRRKSSIKLDLRKIKDVVLVK